MNLLTRRDAIFEAIRTGGMVACGNLVVPIPKMERSAGWRREKKMLVVASSHFGVEFAKAGFKRILKSLGMDVEYALEVYDRRNITPDGWAFNDNESEVLVIECEYRCPLSWERVCVYAWLDELIFSAHGNDKRMRLFTVDAAHLIYEIDLNAAWELCEGIEAGLYPSDESKEWRRHCVRRVA